MLTLIQLINRMIHLEYTREEVEKLFRLVNQGHMPIETVFVVLNCELPKDSILARLKEVLPKADSAINACFLRADDQEY